jgi:uncharacterized spore protein YtfJ
MEPNDVFERVRDSIGAGRVFGEPIERDGVTVIPAAGWIGGAGGGTGGGGEEAEGAGMGFGGMAWPAGAFEIRDGRVTWRPAIDVIRLLMVVVPIAVASIRVLGRR